MSAPDGSLLPAITLGSGVWMQESQQFKTSVTADQPLSTGIGFWGGAARTACTGQPLSAAGRAEPIVPAPPSAACLSAIPGGVLGGWVGAGGAEFRLPGRLGPLGSSAGQAAPLNLAVSLVTRAAALCRRGRVLPFTPVLLCTPVTSALLRGAVEATFIGATLGAHLSKTPREQLML
jgi:hypothetical protein